MTGKCLCPANQVYNEKTFECECPIGYEKTDASARCLPKRPLHDNEDGIESVPGGQDNIKRDTKLALLSVAPLDRLLNQMNMDDKLRVVVQCYPRKFGDYPGEGMENYLQFF